MILSGAREARAGIENPIRYGKIEDVSREWVTIRFQGYLYRLPRTALKDPDGARPERTVGFDSRKAAPAKRPNQLSKF